MKQMPGSPTAAADVGAETYLIIGSGRAMGLYASVDNEAVNKNMLATYAADKAAKC
jgi:hypothetical protein